MSIGTLKSEGTIAESAETKANLLNKQFVSVFTKEDLTNIPDKGQSPFRPMNDIIINEKRVKNVLNVWMKRKPEDQIKFQSKFWNSAQQNSHLFWQAYFSNLHQLEKSPSTGNMQLWYQFLKKEIDPNLKIIDLSH